MSAELNRTAGLAPSPSGPGHLQPRTPEGRAIKFRQLVSAIACLLPAAVLAGPKNGQVVVGEANISTPDANTTVIRQSTDKSVINWQSFSIGSQEYVKFVQPNKSSLSLNRVIGGDPSSILGKLSANGQVYLVNPNGIYFGQGAQVDVSAIVASVLDISNADFMSGNLVFQGDAEQNLGKVINDGIINARNEGYVVLLGDYTENNGVIQAQMGKVVLASGSHITMDISGNNLISVAVNEAVVSKLAGVKNSGEIYADGGRVIMTAKVADNLIGSAVNNEGLVRAASIVEQDGAIFLAASGGNITNSGVLDASAVEGSNADGGGVVVHSDRDITLAPGSAINARGDGTGAGGVVRVIAEDLLDFQSGAAISAAGSPQAGGFVEVSGHGGIKLRGAVDLGSGGTLLIDPSRLTINAGPGFPNGTFSASVGSSFIVGQLTAGNDVYLVASDSISASTAMTIQANNAGDGDLNLAIGTLSTSGGTLGGSGTGSSYGPCISSGVCLGGSGSIAINPDPNGNIRLGNVDFVLAGGLNIAAGSDVGTVSIGAINAGGNVSITAGSNINLEGVVSAAGTSLAVTAGNVGNTTNSNSNINVNGGIGLSGANPLSADVTLNANNNVNIDGDIFVGNNTLTLAADHADGTLNTGNGVGDVNINGSGSCTDGCFGEPRSVITAGDLNISGQNFSVNAADFGSGGISFDRAVPVNVMANRVMVNINGDMTVKGGRINLDVNLGTSGAGGTSKSVDTSVKVVGTSLVDITANNLTVQGGSAAASVSGTFYASSVKAFANAEVAASGGNMTVTLSGSLNVNAGNASAALVSTSSQVDFAMAQANATLAANGTVTIDAPGGVALNAGVALTSVQASRGTASASANALLQSGGNTPIAITSGGLSVFAGTATAQHSPSNDDTASVIARANADLQVGGNLDVTAVGTNVAVRGGNAAARLVGTSTICSSCDLQAHADANVQANNITFTNVAGSFDLVAGAAEANVRGVPFIESIGAMQANANATMTANSVDITAGGNLRVGGGTARAGGSWTSDAVIQAHADALLEASSTNMMLNASVLNIIGGDVTIGGASTVSGDTGTIDATAKADVSATQDVTVVASNGLAISAGNATVNFANASSISADANADATLQGGRDVIVSIASGSLIVQGGIVNATARAGLGGRPRLARASGDANAVLLANRNLNILSVGSNLSISAGTANAQAAGDCVLCDANTRANATLSASAVTVSSIGGALNISGGSVEAVGLGNTCVTCRMDSEANASLSGDSVNINSVGGNLNVRGGDALASPGNNIVTGLAFADARADLSASGALNVNVAGTTNVSGGSASVFGNWVFASTMNATVEAGAAIAAGGNLTLTSATGLSVNGGNANANPAISGGTVGTASASAKAELKAGGLATVNVTAGSVSLSAGFTNPGSSYSSGSPRPVNGGQSIDSAGLAVASDAARPSGSSGTTPLRKASANAVVSADRLQMMASANINGSFASIDANGIYLSAGNNVSLSNTITTVGNGTAPGVSGDSLLLDILDKADIGLPANDNPNALFEAGGSLFTGDVEMTANNGYLWFIADQLSVGNISKQGGDLLVQYSPFTPTNTIGFEDSPTSLEQVNYDNPNHVGSLPMTTVAIGSAQQSGAITVGANGMIDIGARNILLLTTPDSVTLPSNIITTGIVATSGFVASVREEVFVTPRLDNFHVEAESWWLEVERRKQQLVENGDNDHGMCTAL